MRTGKSVQQTTIITWINILQLTFRHIRSLVVSGRPLHLITLNMLLNTLHNMLWFKYCHTLKVKRCHACLKLRHSKPHTH